MCIIHVHLLISSNSYANGNCNPNFYQLEYCLTSKKFPLYHLSDDITINIPFFLIFIPYVFRTSLCNVRSQKSHKIAYLIWIRVNNLIYIISIILIINIFLVNVLNKAIKSLCIKYYFSLKQIRL